MRSVLARSRGRLPCDALGLLVLAFLLPVAAAARPGGGEGYSGPSGGGGGGDGDDGGLVWLLVRLWIEFVIRYPVVGVPLTLVILIFVARHRKKNGGKLADWDSTPARLAPPPPAPRPPSRDLEAVRRLDPAFSAILFEDFLVALYAKAHQARSSRRELEALAPYLSAAAREHLQARRPVGAPVSGVVIGVQRVLDVDVPAATTGAGGEPLQVRVTLELESNMNVGMAGSEHTQYARERWVLVRDATVRTSAPADVRTFPCPNCGAPAGPEGGERCPYCGEVVSGGRFDWSVESIALLQVEEKPPSLATTVAEVGTNWPTIFHPRLQERWAELVREDPEVTREALDARLRLIYGELNAAWGRRDLGGARPYVSDNLFDSLRYWVNAYERQGLRNVLEGMRLVEWKLVKVARDEAFDAMTFRVWGSGRDYTVRTATGDVVSGNPRSDRFYSEYWTLIRGAGARGAPRADKSCPSCGAPLDVNMAGACEHCGAKVTRGEFDWVLSKIEQDDAYTG